MDLTPQGKKCLKKNPLTLAVLKMPPKAVLIDLPSYRQDFGLVSHLRKKITLAVYRSQVPKSKLYSNLEIYEWRHSTQFPIVKSYYVSVRGKETQFSHVIELDVYLEHCPLRLNHIYELSVGQALYLLKESIVGFERLHNRFGGFEICENMISINQRGQCRVWINQNFSSNIFIKKNYKEYEMIQKIISLIEHHSTSTRAVTNLFLVLKNSLSFLSALKSIDSYSQINKIVVPSKFVSIGSLKDIPKPPSPSKFGSEKKVKEGGNPKFVRYSIKSPNKQKNETDGRESPLLQVNSKEKINFHPFEIKRFKSEDKMNILALKASDGETAHTRTLLQAKLSSNLGSLANSPMASQKQSQRRISSKKKKWLQESSFIMGGEESEKPQKPAKKQLTHSEAFQMQKTTPLKDIDRKYSINMMNSKNMFDYSSRRLNQIKESQTNERYMDEFTSILNDTGNTDIFSPRQQIPEQEDEDLIIKEHSNSIIRNNGWSNKFEAFLQTPKQLRESIHAGEEENLVNKDFKLEKLSNLGRREIAMSFLPDEYDDFS